ncbi:MAG: tartrate-resistant acid phosphatase type 5 [Myxococcales bacterium]|nr:tartrate-resistant acid phosphatase type 5 [Myxococcales bacterium]
MPAFHCLGAKHKGALYGPPAPACASWSSADAAATPATTTRFAVIGDYGDGGPNEMAVSVLVKQWKPAFILTTGDNNYPQGAAETIDANIGAAYHDFIAPYLGRFGCGGDRNRFFPSLGNHDWVAEDARPYLEYFQLPGNERYYDSVWGDIHFFAIDSDAHEPDGTDVASAQARWLQQRLAASTARWQVVYMHHPPYSSGPHGPSPQMRWPFKEWGADLVLAGHDHIYERLTVDGLPYVVDGLGGATFYALGPPLPASQVRFTDGAGALLMDADATSLHARFQTVDGRIVDDFTLR